MSKKAWFMAKSIRQNKQQIGNNQGNLPRRPGTVTEVEEVDNSKLTKTSFYKCAEDRELCRNRTARGESYTAE